MSMPAIERVVPLVGHLPPSVGDALVRAPAVVFGPPGLAYRLVLGFVLFAAMAAALLLAAGFGAKPKEDEPARIEDDDAPFVEDEDRGSVSLGWLVHAAMSAKARLWRLATLAYRWLVASSPPPLSSERQEPTLGASRAAPALAPRADEEFDDQPEE